MTDCEGDTCVVFDNGSGVLKVGYAGNDEPIKRVPVMVGQGRVIESGRCSRWDGHLFVGGTAQRHKRTIAITHPMEHGIVTNWDNMIEVWSNAFHSSSEKYAVLLTEAPLTPKSERFQTAQVMFELFKVPALHFANTGRMCLMSAGLTTGVALDIGDGITTAVPVYKGKEVTSCIQRNDFAGRDLSKYLMKLLEGNMGNSWPGFEGSHRYSNTASTRVHVRDAKEKYCYVAKDFKAELAKKPEVHTFQLPDGNPITIGNEAFRCPEALFQPALVGLSAGGIHEITCEAISCCKEDVRETLYENIILCGGTAQLPGLVSRLKKEMAALAPAQVEINIDEPQDTYCAWKGGSILASMSVFKNMLIKKKDYEEIGEKLFN